MKQRTLLFVALAATAVSAHAGDWYGLGMITRSSANTDHAAADGALSAAGATGLSASTDDKSNKWRLQLGYQFNDYLAVEAGYIDIGKTKYSATYTGGSASGEIKSGGPDVVALGMLPLGNGFSAFGELGLIDAKTKTSLSASGVAAAASDKYDKTKLRPLYGVGGIYNFNDTTAMRVSLERVNNLGDKGRLGNMDVNMYSIGLSYKF